MNRNAPPFRGFAPEEVENLRAKVAILRAGHLSRVAKAWDGIDALVTAAVASKKEEEAILAVGRVGNAEWKLLGDVTIEQLLADIGWGPGAFDDDEFRDRFLLDEEE